MTDDGALGETPLVYAIGDIHGSLQKLRDLITLCERHADGRLATFVFLAQPQRRAEGYVFCCEIRTVTCFASSEATTPISKPANRREAPYALINNIVPVVLSLSGNELVFSISVARAGLEQPQRFPTSPPLELSSRA